jgi:hypothetical protein
MDLREVEWKGVDWNQVGLSDSEWGPVLGFLEPFGYIKGVAFLDLLGNCRF